jgi:hypothetical protein
MQTPTPPREALLGELTGVRYLLDDVDHPPLEGV